jgi:hypothetical protein
MAITGPFRLSADKSTAASMASRRTPGCWQSCHFPAGHGGNLRNALRPLRPLLPQLNIVDHDREKPGTNIARGACRRIGREQRARCPASPATSPRSCGRYEAALPLDLCSGAGQRAPGPGQRARASPRSMRQIEAVSGSSTRRRPSPGTRAGTGHSAPDRMRVLPASRQPAHHADWRRASGGC